MMKPSLTLAVVIGALPCVAQDPGNTATDPGGPGTPKQVVQKAGPGTQDRTAEIIAAAHDRIDRQNDAFFHEGEFLPVIKNVELLVELNPQDEEAWSTLIWMYGNVEDPVSQWLACRRFARANPTYTDAKYYEAQFLFQKRQYAKVPPLLEPAIAKTPPPDDNAFRFLAHAYNKMGYYEDALRVWDAYLKIKPSDGQAVANRKKVADRLAKG